MIGIPPPKQTWRAKLRTRAASPAGSLGSLDGCGRRALSDDRVWERPRAVRPSSLARAVLPTVVLAMLPLAPAEACVPLMLNVSGKLVQHPGTITLNSDGSWSVKDWATVEEAPKVFDGNPLSLCIVRSLLARPPSLRINKAPIEGQGEQCTVKAMQAVIDRDPIAHQCGASAR
jgi:hypothetical protein